MNLEGVAFFPLSRIFKYSDAPINAARKNSAEEATTP
jgi:hypothetical protein